MITIIEGSSGETLEEAYHLRHRVFVDELGWEALRKPDGREIDRYDDEHAVHMLLHQDRQLIGYQRMLPTTRPYLLTDLYPALSDDAPPKSPTIFEWTRFAVDRKHRGDGTGLGRAGAELVLGFVEWGLARGVSAVVVELAPAQMLKFAQCHFRAIPLGIIQTIGGQDTIAVLARFDERTRAQLERVVQAMAAQPLPRHGLEGAAA